MITARDFNTGIRDRVFPAWAGHIGLTGAIDPSCGCPSCTRARFDMEVK